ncbi:cytochrome c [Chitinophaga qingshengii]|uniref:Cytochrome c n=1 Tax=Chitinophaga qingshengii TaxID=1569794 RepID=A0ABR7TH37_9BACT|nr:cytochrome c [Chitinophaga qingshengii]MBC9929798.1 cytochrome c [Chitinophaga qingshengii]
MRLYILFVFTLMSLIGCISCRQASPVPVKADSIVIKLAAGYQQGRGLFRRYCSSCHTPPEKKMADNYMFSHLFDRMPAPSTLYFIRYVQDSKALKKAGDTYAIEIGQYWGLNYNHHFRDSMTLTEIRSLIVYIRVATNRK